MEMAPLDGEMRSESESYVGGEGRGQLVVWP